jgi:hypothetical protein
MWHTSEQNIDVKENGIFPVNYNNDIYALKLCTYIYIYILWLIKKHFKVNSKHWSRQQLFFLWAKTIEVSRGNGPAGAKLPFSTPRGDLYWLLDH